MKNYKYNFFVSNELEIETVLIGYKNEGEAILFFVICDGKVSFSGLIDCYETSDNNKVNEILIEKKVNQLDFICWTHPDIDHSKGLKKIIDKFATENTSIWIPEGVEDCDIICSEEVKNFFNSLKELLKSRKSKYNVYSTSDKKELLYYDSRCFHKDAKKFPLELTSYSPNSCLIRKKTYCDSFKKNDRSIFFSLSLGKIVILFTGDIEDETIELLPNEFADRHIHILKIPHHGSETSTKFLNHIDKCDIAFSTVYRKGKSNLPNELVMNNYKNKSELLYCTGNKDKEKEEKKYGIVKVITNVLKDEYEVYLDGNALLWNQ